MLCRQKDLNISGTSAHESGPENEPSPSPQENIPTSPKSMTHIKSDSEMITRAEFGRPQLSFPVMPKSCFV